MWRCQGRSPFSGEVREGRGSVVGPEDDGRSLARRNWVEAVVIPCGLDGRDADHVAVESEVDMDRLPIQGNPKGLGEPRRV